jgi:hypothetical protein
MGGAVESAMKPSRVMRPMTPAGTHLQEFLFFWGDEMTLLGMIAVAGLVIMMLGVVTWFCVKGPPPPERSSGVQRTPCAKHSSSTDRHRTAMESAVARLAPGQADDSC